MTYTDKNFEFKTNIKEIIARNIRKYEKQRNIRKNNWQLILTGHLNLSKKLEQIMDKEDF